MARTAARRLHIQRGNWSVLLPARDVSPHLRRPDARLLGLLALRSARALMPWSPIPRAGPERAAQPATEQPVPRIRAGGLAGPCCSLVLALAWARARLDAASDDPCRDRRRRRGSSRWAAGPMVDQRSCRAAADGRHAHLASRGAREREASRCRRQGATGRPGRSRREGVRLAPVSGERASLERPRILGSHRGLRRGRACVAVNELPLEEYVAGAVQGGGGRPDAARDVEGPGDRGADLRGLPPAAQRRQALPHRRLDRCTSSTSAASRRLVRVDRGQGRPRDRCSSGKGGSSRPSITRTAVATRRTRAAVFAASNMPALKPVRVEFPSASP